MIRSYLKKNKDKFKNIKIDIVDTGINSSIATRIYKVKKYIKSKNFLLLNGDAVFDFNIKNLYEKHMKTNKDITFLGNPAQLPMVL